LVEHGFLNAVSVGFTPVEAVQRPDGGTDYQKIELMELSLVPVPSNRDALIQASAKGVDVKPISDWALNILGQEHKSEIAEIKKSLDRIEKTTTEKVVATLEEFSLMTTRADLMTRANLVSLEKSVSDLVLGLKALAEELEEVDEVDEEDTEDKPRSDLNFSEHNLDRPAKSSIEGLDEGGDPAVEEAEEVKAGSEGLDEGGDPAVEEAEDVSKLVCPKCGHEGVKMDHEDCPGPDDEESKKRAVASFTKQLSELVEAFRLVSNVQPVPPVAAQPSQFTAEQISAMVKQAVANTVKEAVNKATGRLD
jgi:hypothetical protein